MTTRTTVAASIALALTLHLAGCDAAPRPKSAAAVPSHSPPTTASPAGAADQDFPGPTERDPAAALAFWEAAMERRDWASAYRVFGHFGQDSGMTAQEFAATWEPYRTLEVTIGRGRQEGAAGSTYYKVPVRIAGVTQSGKPYGLAGQLTLRRVNDIAGASAEQLRWHIERWTLQP